MPVRVTAEEVKDILDTELSNSRIEAFIDSANVIITRLLGSANLGNDLLKKIELWLSAHYIKANTDRQAIEEEAGPARQRFSDVFDVGLDSTTYGQTAKTLDPTGSLASMDKKRINLISIHEDRS